MQKYLVGGAVRDSLLKRPVKDRDWVVVGATPKQMLAQGYQAVGADFPVFLHPKTQEEYALARTERKTAKGYNGFECDASEHITLEQDLLRRDLTINAMAMDEQGTIIDPYNGQNDLSNKVLRHVSDAFVEDPLRVLRVARFAARFHQLGFSIAPETLALMQSLVEQQELQALNAERVWQETARSLLENNPEVYFQTLRACGALTVWFTELDAVWNKTDGQTTENGGLQCLQVLQQAVQLSDKLSVRYAALVVVLGNNQTSEPNAGLEPIKQLSQRLKVPNECRDLALIAGEFHPQVLNAFELAPDVLLNLFNRCDVWRKPQRFQDFLLICKASAGSRTNFANQAYVNADYVWQAYQVANQVDVKAIVAKGFQGKAIKEQLEQQRVSVIAEFKKGYIF